MNPADALTAFGVMSVVAAAMVGGIGVLIWWWDRHHPVSPIMSARVRCPGQRRIASIDLVGDPLGGARLTRCSLRTDLGCDQSCLRARVG